MTLDSFETEPPRRNALRALFASGLAMVGLSSVIGSAPAKVKTQKKKKKKKNGNASIVLGGSQPYDVAAGAATSVTSTCPTNTSPISVLAQNVQRLCWISSSSRSEDGTGWTVTVNCPPTVTTTGTVQAVCFKAG